MLSGHSPVTKSSVDANPPRRSWTPKQTPKRGRRKNWRETRRARSSGYRIVSWSELRPMSSPCVGEPSPRGVQVSPDVLPPHVIIPCGATHFILHSAPCFLPPSTHQLTIPRSRPFSLRATLTPDGEDERDAGFYKSTKTRQNSGDTFVDRSQRPIALATLARFSSSAPPYVADPALSPKTSSSGLP